MSAKMCALGVLKRVKRTYYFISTLFLARMDIGGVKHLVQEWHFTIVDER